MSDKPALPPPRVTLLGLLAVVMLAAMLRAWDQLDDRGDFLLALGLVLLFTPLKALMIRWLGGRRPYVSAVTASVFSAYVGIAFQADLNLWSLLLRSTIFTAALEMLPLFALRTTDSPVRLAVLSLYMSVVVHCFSGGFVLVPRAPLIGGALIAGGVVALWLPLFLRRTLPGVPN